MKIFLGGVRGTTPRAAPRFTEFGGHTTCLLVSGEAGELVMLDAGSGVQEANPLLIASERRELLVLMTHLHLDHLMGLPTLEPLYDPSWHVEIMAADQRSSSLADDIARITTPPLWPVPLDQMGADVKLRELPASELGPGNPMLSWGGLEITGTTVPHPNGCVAWRIDETSTGKSMVFSTDTEWSAAGGSQRDRIVSLCATPHPADLLLMDGQFDEEQLPQHSGWGHSSPAEGMEVARKADVKRLLVIHHAPGNDDDTLGRMEAALQQLSPDAALARQGETIVLT